MHGSSPGRPPGSTESDGSLGAVEIEVWWLAAPEEAGAASVDRCAALLDADERARGARFRNEADRRRYLLAHALVRTTLSRYAPGTPPARWRFRTGPHGRPELAPEAGSPALRFNLSHTAGLVACAVALDRDVGVDVEHGDPPRFDAEACLEIARSHFAPAEVAGLEALRPEARRERFFAIWTLKEAYIKARGLGLALPLGGFSFEVGGPAPAASPEIRVQFDPALQDDAARWHFARLRPSPAHALALAARRAPGEVLAVRVCEAHADSL